MAKIAYIDVDDTLIRTAGTKRIPIVNVIQHVRELKEDGWELYCWSSGGAEYARVSAAELGLTSCFVMFLPKPNLMIDDVAPSDWSFLRVIHPTQIQS